MAVPLGAGFALRTARLDALLQSTDAIVVGMDRDGILTEWSAGAQRLFGYTRDEVLGHHASILAPPERKEEASHSGVRLARGEAVRDFRTVRVAKDGTRLEVSMDLAPVRSQAGAYDGAIGVLHDLSGERRLERHVQYLERSYAMLAGIIDAAVRIRDLPALHREACRVAVERGGLRMAWVGMIDPRTELVTPVAHAGHEDGYLLATNITARTSLRGMGPTGRAIREGRPIVSADVEHDPAMEPWRQAALSRGYRSAAAFPLRKGGRIVGTMNFYSGERDFFTPSAVSLLASIANVLSFAADSAASGVSGPA